MFCWIQVHWLYLQLFNLDRIFVNPFTSRKLSSEKNGEIVVRRWLGKPEVEVDGYVQSGEYMCSLWSDALWRARTHPSIQSVLMLGLGCGSSISALQNHFPDCDITVLEWDPVMIELANELAWFTPSLKVSIVCGDAFKELPKMPQGFDLVLCDLFRGDVLETRLNSQAMISSIAQIMKPHGQLIVNAFKNESVFDAFEMHLDFVQHWRFRNNSLALFRLLFPK